MNCSALPPGAAFTTPPSVKLPAESVPSLVDVTLSGKLLSGRLTGADWACARLLEATPTMSANPAVPSARAQRLLSNSPCASELEATLCSCFMIVIPDCDELDEIM